MPKTGTPASKRSAPTDRGTLGVDAGRSAGEDDGGRVLGQQLLGGVGMRNYFRIHVGFPDAAGNQLRVLGTVVNNQDGLVGSLGRGGISHHPILTHAVGPESRVVGASAVQQSPGRSPSPCSSRHRLRRCMRAYQAGFFAEVADPDPHLGRVGRRGPGFRRKSIWWATKEATAPGSSASP